MKPATSILAISLLITAAACAANASDPGDDTAAPEPKATGGASGGTTGNTGGISAAAGGAGGTQLGTGGSAPAAGGNSATGGTGGALISSDFELSWEDHFDSFNAARWAKASHTFPENLAGFAPENAMVESGVLKLRITAQARGNKPYTAGEVYSTEQFLYGRFEARIRFASGSGIVSSLFTYKDDPLSFWNEIDIEALGNLPQSIQYNIITSAPGGGSLTYQPRVDSLGISPYTDFHTYAFEWRPNDVRFFVDNVPRHTETRNVATRLTERARLRMNCWPTNNEVTSFAGSLNRNAIPAEAQYDWVRIYRYVGDAI